MEIYLTSMLLLNISVKIQILKDSPTFVSIMSLLRVAVRLRVQAHYLTILNARQSLGGTQKHVLGANRTYASAKKQSKPTATLVPGSKQPITDKAAQEEYAKTESSMQKSIEWYRKECAMIETRASGRVTPALLSPVRVKLPDNTSEVSLEDVATVGVREGSTLLITVFEENVGSRLPSPKIDTI